MKPFWLTRSSTRFRRSSTSTRNSPARGERNLSANDSLRAASATGQAQSPNFFQLLELFFQEPGWEGITDVWNNKGGGGGKGLRAVIASPLPRITCPQRNR